MPTGPTHPERGTRPVPEAARRRDRVAIVGAGLTGLAAAWTLRDDLDVVVFEASDRVGGQIRTDRVADVAFDVGADAFLARQPEAEALARALGFGDEDLVEPAVTRVQLWTRGRLRPLPDDTVLGVPTSLRALARSRALRPSAVARAALEPVVPRRSDLGDRSIADLLGRRFGNDVVDGLVEPLLGGVYAGRADRLSVQATMPPVWAALRTPGSLRAALRDQRSTTLDDARPVFLTLRGGLSRLTDRLRRELGERVRVGSPVVGLQRDGERWRLEIGGVRGGARPPDVFDAVVLAMPARQAAELLTTVDRPLARELAAIRTASVGVVALAYSAADAGGVPDLSGVLVPRREGRLVKAVTVTSRKWPHHREHRDLFLLRASVGRVDDTDALGLDDDALSSRVDAEVRRALRIRGPARERLVVRWPDALPQYEVGHLARVDRVRYALADRLPGLQIGGASLEGVGLAARARDASRLAHEVRRQLAIRAAGTHGTRE